VSDHQKHPKLKRPEFGTFSVNEIGLMGAPCGDIQRLARDLTEHLKDLKLGYIDARHGNDSSPTLTNCSLQWIQEPEGFIAQSKESWSAFNMRSQTQQADLCLINGNHFESAKQVVILHPAKLESLQRKLDRLNNILVFVCHGVSEIPEFVKEACPSWSTIPVIDFDESGLIAQYIRTSLKTPLLKGLVLAGGKSTRMGTDKGKLVYHQKTQREHMFGLLSPYCSEVYTSCREDQVAELAEFNPLPDRMIGMGPFGAICTAFMHDPEAAWLVVACDLPLLDDSCVAQLYQERSTTKVATAFLSPDTGFPEPLVAIWEPRSYSRLLQFLSQGYSCPRKVLINSAVKLIVANDPRCLSNVNTPAELQQFGGKVL
jgi:molybdenum cofactor guanylyltransferase